MSAAIMTEAPKEIYTAEEAAEYLRVNVRTIHRMIKRGELRAISIGGKYRIRKSALDQVMDGSPPSQKEDSQDA